jgi:hypothetical protein
VNETKGTPLPVTSSMMRIVKYFVVKFPKFAGDPLNRGKRLKKNMTEEKTQQFILNPNNKIDLFE